MRLMRALVAAAIVSLALASVPYPALADGGVTTSFDPEILSRSQFCPVKG